MKRLFVFIGIIGMFAFTSCTKKGCPNDLQPEQPEQIHPID